MLQGIVVFAAEYREDNESIPGWNVIYKYADGKAVVSGDEKHSGKASMKIINNTPNKNDVYISPSYKLNVVKGHTYTYGFAVKSKNSKRAVVCIDWGSSGKSSIIPFGASSDWRELGFEYTHKAETGTVDLRFLIEDKTEGIWIDDLYFYDEAESDINMISNPSFEGMSVLYEDNGEADQTTVIPIVYKNDVKIDGVADEWTAIEKTVLTSFRMFEEGEKSLEASIGYAYDEENLYFVMDVEDDVHYSVLDSANYWKADSVQFAICNSVETFGAQYSIAYDEDSKETAVYGAEEVKAKVSRANNHTIYEVAMPWALRFDGKVPEMLKFNAIVNDNDNDELGRKYCLEIAPGIADKKDGELYPRLLPLNNEQYSVWFEGNESVTVGECANYTLTLFNATPENINFEITGILKDDKRKLELKTGQTETIRYEVKCDEIGYKEVSVVIWDGKEEQVRTAKTSVWADEAVTRRIIAQQKKYYAELTELVEKCMQAGLSCDYEKINYHVIERFISYLEDDITNGYFDRVYHEDKAMTELYNESKNSMLALLNGEKEPIEVPKYITSPIEVTGKHFVATTKIGNRTERRPVFFVGSGHWEQSREDIPNLHKFGLNAIELGIEPYRIFDVKDSIPEWDLRTFGEYKIKYYTEKNEKKSGNYSLGIKSDMPYSFNNFNYITQTVEVEPNTTYEYGLSAKTENATGWPLFSIDGAVQSRWSFTGTHDWTDYVQKFTTGKDQRKVTFSIYIDAPADAIYIDDAFIRPLGKEENLLKNADFEGLSEDMNSDMQSGIEYQVHPEPIQEIERYLEACEAGNLSAAYLYASQNFSRFICMEDPTINNRGGKFWNSFVSFNPTHPEIVRLNEMVAKTVLPRLKDYEAFDHIILANEPVFVSYVSDQFYLPMYRAHLKEKYGDIENLNRCWGTSYEDFSETEMPQKVDGTPQFTDWRIFNDQIMYDYHSYLADYAREAAPGIPISSKLMQPFIRYGNGRVEGGSSNLAPLTQMMDVNGLDAWAYYNTSDRDIISKMAYYDLRTSFLNAPVYNFEDHIIQDGTVVDYNDNELKFTLTDLWQGAIHGRGGSIIWVWDRGSRNGQLYVNSLLAARPAHMAEIGKLNLDLNRLSEEIVKIQDTKPNVAMLYSINSLAWSPIHQNAMYNAYAAVGNNGQKVEFIDETQIDKLSEFNILIIPSAVAVSQEVFNAIKTFSDRGGQILIIDEASLTKDEYGKDLNESERRNIFAKAMVIPVTYDGTIIDDLSTEKILAGADKLISDNELDAIIIKDAATGTKLEDAEWLYVAEEDGYIINLCRYSYETTDVEIYINGVKVEAVTDLKNRKIINGIINLEGYTPMLLKVSVR